VLILAFLSSEAQHARTAPSNLDRPGCNRDAAGIRNPTAQRDAAPPGVPALDRRRIDARRPMPYEIAWVIFLQVARPAVEQSLFRSSLRLHDEAPECPMKTAHDGIPFRFIGAVHGRGMPKRTGDPGNPGRS
jgi:hypothetical protein